MSIRFHKGPALLTIFHDPSSSISNQALKLLRQAQSQTETQTQTSTQNTDSPSSAYLKEASSKPLSNRLELEILNKKTSPPTSDQMQSILSYLKNSEGKLGFEEDGTTSASSSPPESESKKDSLGHKAIDGSKTGKEAPTGLNSKTYQKENKIPNSLSQLQEREGPLIVFWDEGLATTTLEGTKALLKRVEKDEAGSAVGGKLGCLIS